MKNLFKHFAIDVLPNIYLCVQGTMVGLVGRGDEDISIPKGLRSIKELGGCPKNCDNQPRLVCFERAEKEGLNGT